MKQRYCNTVVIREKNGIPDIKFLTISLGHFYLSRKFQQLIKMLVSIHPRAIARTAAHLITDVTHKLVYICPETTKFILGDFNHCNLKIVLKTYKQYMMSPTTPRKTKLDLCSVSGIYKLVPVIFCSFQSQQCVSSACLQNNSVI